MKRKKAKRDRARIWITGKRKPKRLPIEEATAYAEAFNARAKRLGIKARATVEP